MCAFFGRITVRCTARRLSTLAIGDMADQLLGPSSGAQTVERLWAMSDVHTDTKENLDFISRLDPLAFRSDGLIVAGDVSDDMSIVRLTLRSLRSKFARVFFVPGNHELWVGRRRSDGCADSLQKLAALEQLCAEEGVDAHPSRLVVSSGRAGAQVNLWVIPLLSWHSPDFDTEAEIDARWTGIPAADQVCGDYFQCKWPPPLKQQDGSVSGRLDSMNDERLSEAPLAGDDREKLAALFESGTRDPGDIVVSFSHFLPRIELTPEKRYLYFPCLNKFVGSLALGARVSRLHPDIHVFGHTHFGWDQELDGVRYLSPPVGYPRERSVRMSTIAVGGFPEAAEHEEQATEPVLVWSASSGFPGKYPAGWSGFYQQYPREPDQALVLPDYVADRYHWDEKRHGPKGAVTGWNGKIPAWRFGPEWSQASRLRALDSK